MAEASELGELTEASETKYALCMKLATRLAAASIARRVLPVPPGPTSVNRRQAGLSNRSAIWANSSVLPTKDVGWDGRWCDPLSEPFGTGKDGKLPIAL